MNNQYFVMKERKCLQCGGNRFKELKGGLRKCLYCGTTVQYEFRKAEKQVVEQPREHYLTIISQGVFLIMDAKVNVEINGISSGRFSLRDGFVVKVPTTKIMVVTLSFAFCSQTYNLVLDDSQHDYELHVSYSRMSGWFKDSYHLFKV
jgi:hypothetical protein